MRRSEAAHHLRDRGVIKRARERIEARLFAQFLLCALALAQSVPRFQLGCAARGERFEQRQPLSIGQRVALQQSDKPNDVIDRVGEPDAEHVQSVGDGYRRGDERSGNDVRAAADFRRRRPQLTFEFLHSATIDRTGNRSPT